jgi:diguanylate cyclase (GGDEF)-like protein
MKKIFYISIPFILALLAFIFVYRYFNHEDKNTSLTVGEKRWVEQNKDNTYDLNVINDYPLYGLEGRGVIFDYLKDFEENIGIEFNQNPISKTDTKSTDEFDIRVVKSTEKLDKNDLIIAEDYYVFIGKQYERINHVEDIKNSIIGVFPQDVADISFYMKSATNISFKEYKTIDELYKALDKGTVNMICVPNIMYLDYTITTGKYEINYFLTELTQKIVISPSKNNDKLNTIVEKYFNKWKYTKFVKEYNKEYLNYYMESNNISAESKSSLLSKNYVYGYVENLPYETKINGSLAGIAGEYINRLERLTDINFEYKKYNTKKELKEAIDKGEVDIYFDYYNYNNNKYNPTKSTFIEDYVVLDKKNNNNIVTTFESLRGKEISMMQEDSLYNYFSNNSKAKIKTYSSINELAKNKSNRLLVVDSETYNYYQNSKFSKYKLLYKDTMMNDYKFMVKSNNSAFYDLFNYIINTNSYYNYRNSGIENMNATILEESSLQQVYTIVLALIFIPLIAIALIYLFFKKKNQKKKVKITDRQKYTDMLTSLKNRNYLNVKMREWEDCEVFPQAIVMVDLNNVKYVNDNYGHEEGDQLIIKAASILVNTQLENSEIIRTDGNEFLIYLIGYSERQISTYTKKLSKEMRSLPHEFGAAVGFSMITDEIKTLDDAINEATLEMITNKEDYK